MWRGEEAQRHIETGTQSDTQHADTLPQPSLLYESDRRLLRSAELLTLELFKWVFTDTR